MRALRMRTSRPPSTRIPIPAARSGFASGAVPSIVAPAKSTVILSPRTVTTAESSEVGAWRRYVRGATRADLVITSPWRSSIVGTAETRRAGCARAPAGTWMMTTSRLRAESRRARSLSGCPIILLAAQSDINGVAVLRQQQPQQLHRALVGVIDQRELSAGRNKLRSRLTLNGIPVFARKRVPQSAALVVGLHVANLHRDELRRRYANGDPLSLVIDHDVRVVAQVDPCQKASRDYYQRTLGRAVPGILVDDDVANGRLARDEFRYRFDLIDDDIVGDVRLIAAEQGAGHKPARAIAEAEEDEQSSGDEQYARADSSVPRLRWQRRNLTSPLQYRSSRSG